MQMLRYLLISMRPKQWMKNLFVFAALVFVRGFTDAGKVAATAEAFILFCLVSSAVYLVNDVVDREADKTHPTKKNRPVAAGLLSPSVAIIAALLLSGGALLASFYLSVLFGGVLSAYVALNLLYSFCLKRFVILDVFSIALGFVLRVAGGAAVIAVPVSVWIIVCTFFLTLFLAVNKRLAELELSPGGSREVLLSYSHGLLAELRTVSLSTVIIAYTFYTFSSEHSKLLMLTVPIVLYGLFYYMHALKNRSQGHGDPTDIVLREPALKITIALYGLVSAAILFFAR